jgi:hypothetical protein
MLDTMLCSYERTGSSTSLLELTELARQVVDVSIRQQGVCCCVEIQAYKLFKENTVSGGVEKHRFEVASGLDKEQVTA